VRATQGRPLATSHAAIEAAAFTLFERDSFDATTVDDIAEAVGVGRRTLFRYFPSKNDIPWGQFDESLAYFKSTLDSAPREKPVIEVVQQAVIKFNRFDEQVMAQHRQRMRIILSTPTLQAHSVLRYAQWRAVIADYVAERYDIAPNALLPRTVGHVSLALALSAYEQWLETDGQNLEELLTEAMAALSDYVGSGRRKHR
jgi:TetR/AcrR family transcriptional regulator, regulator of mycofactocin system